MRRLQQGNCHDEAWKTSTHVCLGFPHIPTLGRGSYCLPLLPPISQHYSPLSVLQLLLLPSLSHSLNSSPSAALSAKCLPRLHLAVVVRVSIVVDVVHRPQPVLHLKILYFSKTLQTMERTILLREQTIPPQRYESTHSPTRTTY